MVDSKKGHSKANLQLAKIWQVNFGWDNPTSEHFSDHYSNTAKYFSIKNTTIGVLEADDTVSRIAKLKNWLSDNPVTFQYQLMVPIITELDYETYKVLTYYPYTQFYTVGSELSPDLDVTVRVIE